MLTLFTSKGHNATATLFALVRGLRARVTRVTVQNTLLEHPDFPSLLSLSDVLTDWKIDNTALQLNSVEQLRELPMPFIAHLHKNDGWYVLINALKGNLITYTDSQSGQITEPLAKFEKKWSGVVLLTETDKQSGEPNYLNNRRLEILDKWRQLFVLLCAFIICLLFMLNPAAIFTGMDWLLFVTKVVGLCLSVLLAAKQLGLQSNLTDHLCQINSKTNCDSILDSPAAKLWGWLSWSDVGLLYFSGEILTVLLAGSLSNAYLILVRPLLHGLALLALPYTIFSVYYQGRVIRQWCPLCLGVLGVLLIEGVLAIAQLRSLPNEWSPYMILLTAFLLPILLWILIKPQITKAAQSRNTRNELLWLKRNPDLFKSLLKLHPRMPVISDNLCPIMFGNPDAEHTITMVTNPYCGPCAKAHIELEQLLERYVNVKVEVIFLACDGPTGKIASVVKHLLAVSDQKLALHDWYAFDRKDYAEWCKQYPISGDDPYYIQLAQRHCDWCQRANIIETPTLFIDGYQRPTAYSLPQIGRFIHHLESPKPIEIESL